MCMVWSACEPDAGVRYAGDGVDPGPLQPGGLFAEPCAFWLREKVFHGLGKQFKSEGNGEDTMANGVVSEEP